VSPPDVGTSARALRAEFDSSFARAPAVESDPSEDFLVVRVGEEPYAMRLSDVAGLYAGRVVTALPGSPLSLVGVTALGGAVVAVYDLCVLLGGAGGWSHPWMVLTSVDTQVALAFNQFEGHISVPRRAVARSDGETGDLAVVTVAGIVRPIVAVPALLESIRSLADPAQRSDAQ
jgi:purine-binding chemotaxis protein CheW